jgi:hypothetical protein
VDEQRIQDYLDSHYLNSPVSPPNTSPLAIEQPGTLSKMIRLLKAHAKGPEAFDQEWKKVQAKNQESSTPSSATK